MPLLEFNSLNIYAPVEGPTGYDKVSRELIKQFYRKGYDMSLKKFDGWSPVKINLLPDIRRLVDRFEKNIIKPFVHLNICLPEQVIHLSTHYNMLFTMFEADKITDPWVRYCNDLDLIFVPSVFSANAFISSGVRSNKVKVVGLGVDMEEYHPDVKPLDFVDEDGNSIVDQYKYRFLNVQELVDRKNLYGLLRSWINATDKRKDCCLVLKLSSYTESRLDFFNDRIDAVRNKLGKKGAPVFVYTKLLTEEKVPNFFALGTHYLSMSYGEGWDLCAMQMGAMKKTIIAPYSSAYTMYLHKENSYLIGIEGKENADQSGATKRLYEGAQWSIPSEKEATEIIKRVVEGDESISPDKFYEEIKDNWVWDKVVDRMIDNINNVFFDRTVKYERAVEATPGNYGFLFLCKTANTPCGIGEYSNALYNDILKKIKRPPMYVSGPDSPYVSIFDSNHLGVIHIQYEYQFYTYARFDWILHEMKARGYKVILTQHTVTRDATNYNDIIVKYVDTIIVHSEKSKEEYDKLGAGDKVKILPMGCSPVLSEDNLKDIKPKFENKEGETVIGFFGFTYFHKGIDKLMRMCDSLSKDIGNIKLRIFAVKPEQDHKNYFEYCHDIMQQFKYPIEWCTEYLPEKELIANLQTTDIIALPYKEHGGWGTSAAVRTCMRAQVPIVCSDISFFSDLPEDVVCRVSLDKFEEAIKNILNNDILKEKYRNKIKEYTEVNSWENVAQIHLDLYEKYFVELEQESFIEGQSKVTLEENKE